MAVMGNGTGSARLGTRRRLREQRERERKLVLRHRWYAGGIATLLSGALLFAGMTPAVADPTTPSPLPSASETTEPSPEPTEPHTDPSETPAEPEQSTEPSEEPSEAPSEPATEETLPADGDRSAARLAPSDDAGVGVLSVPSPGATSSVITVKVGSDRTGVTGVTNLQGVTLLLNTNNNGAPTGTRPDGVAGTGDGWAKCVSDAQGDCSFTVPNTNSGGAQNNTRPWVVQAPSGVPADYYTNPVLRVGGASGAGSQLAYQFRLKTGLQANTVYSSQDASDLMLGSGDDGNVSGGIWQQSRSNPGLVPSCGLDVALILDISGSVGGALPNLKQAANTFVNSLVGTPSRMSLFSFSWQTPGSGASNNYPDLTSVSTAPQADAFKALYSGWTSGGGTNWDRGLGVAASANNGANKFDVAVIITDGNPTTYNQPYQGSGSDNRFRETENGIFSANAIKAAGSRVIAFGVGDGATGGTNGLNLRAISGTTVFNGTNGQTADYYQTSDYAAVGTALRNLALGNCSGNLTVTKQIVPSTAPAGSIQGATPAGSGWQFNGVSNTAGVSTPTASRTTTNDGTGTVAYPLTFGGGITSGSVTVTETQQAGFTLQQVNGANAVCTNLNTGASVPVTASGGLGFTVDVPSTQGVNCVVYNRAPNPEADVEVDKKWIVNGVAYSDGAQPGGLSAQLTLTGPGNAPASNQGWGVVRSGYTVGQSATFDESVTLIDPALCTNSARITSLNGVAKNDAIPAGGFAFALTLVHNTAEITNTVTCRSTLTLVKQVQGGNAAPSAWTLQAPTTVPGALPFAQGVSGVKHDVTPDARYQLAETGGNALYAQTDERTNLQSNPLSTGSATCIRVNADGTPYPGSGFSDGINGGVNVPLGFNVACTFTNQTASLTLRKHVVNDNGGTATASSWLLTATPAPLPGLSATTVTGSETAVPASTFGVRPDHVYTLTESGVSGYTNVKLQQFVGGAWVDVVADPDPARYPQKDGAGNWLITVDALGSDTYRFVNDDIAPILTLVKTVTNDDGGTALPSDWTLSATTPGGPDLSGQTGTLPVTAQPVKAGVVYTVGETGPAAYDWTSLTCTDHPNATAASPTLTLAPGENVTCTLNNDDVAVPVSIEKADGVVAQLADGTWTISYEVVVTNDSATLPTTYSLTDSPDFDSSFTILSQGWQGDPDVTDVAIEGGGVDTHTYVVTAETNESPVDPTALVCSSTTGGGFFNSATVTFPGGTDTDTGCAVPAAPVVEKVAQTLTQNPGTGEWTLSYQVSVTNPSGIALAYTLTDTAAALPAGVTGGTWTASDPTITGGGTFVRDAAWSGSGDLATGSFPAGATHTYTVSRVVTIAQDVPENLLVCGASPTSGGGFWNSATVSNGVGGNSDEACITISRPGVDIAKTVTSTTHNVDGTWTVVYDVAVTNESPTLVAQYGLTDQILYGAGIVPTAATWKKEPGGAVTPFQAPITGIQTLATNAVLAGGATDRYTVTVTATISADAWKASSSTLTCAPEGSFTAGGFLNTATATAAGKAPERDDACSAPDLPEILKEGVAATQDGADPEKWAVSYTVTVTAGEYDTYYDLSDTPAFASGITLGAGTAQRTDIPGQPTEAITSGAIFVIDRAIAANTSHTYTVTWIATVTDAFDPDDATCSATPGKGFFNTATLTVGEVPLDGTACIPVEARVYPTIEKSVSSTAQNADGDWVITYDVVVALAPQGEENPNGLSAAYHLTDTLDFGGDIDVGDAEWTYDGTTTDFEGDPATMATDRPIAAGATHTYTVRVVADVTAAAIEDGTTSCDPSESPEAGGFLNTAQLESGGVLTDVDACSEPVFPNVDKTAVGEAVLDEETGLWRVTYQVTVSYPELDPAGDDPVVAYTLTDAPTLPAGVELAGDWTASAEGDGTPDPTAPTWNGQGTWTIVSSTLDPDETDVTEHVFEITAQVRVTAPATGTLPTCDDEPGIVVVNGATVTSGGFTADDDACQVVHFDDVGIVKTSELPEDQDWVEPGDTFDYVLTVTNYGTRPATNVTVTDDDLNERLEIIGLTVTPGSLMWGPEPGYDDANEISLTIDSLPVGGVATITVEVEFLPAAVTDDDVVGPGEEPPTAPIPVEQLENTACVTATNDGDDANDCDDEDIPVRDLTGVLYIACVSDAAKLGWSIAKSGSLVDLPIEMLWEPNNGASETVPPNVQMTQAAGSSTWSEVIDWPGSEYTPSGVAVDYPGWRAIVQSDVVPGSTPTQYYLPGTTTVMTPAEQAQFVYNGLILDPSELDFAWREGSTVTFTVNPELVFETSYPTATPDGCSVARHSDVQIEKTASVERTEPGESFTYTLEVQNVSDDSAADGVVVTDVIPSDIRISDVTWPGKGDATAFPNWTTCEVTGQGAGGYGGTLECALFGPLQPAGTPAGGTSAAPTIALTAYVSTTAKANVINNIGVVDYHTFGDPDDPGRDQDDATVLLSALPATGGESMLPIAIIALVALLGGTGALIVIRRRRGESRPVR